jgi:hypothetical protein
VKTYTFYLHDGPESIPAFEIEMFATQPLALAYGRRLLDERPRYNRVIVTEEVAEIARFDRPARLVEEELRAAG